MPHVRHRIRNPRTARRLLWPVERSPSLPSRSLDAIAVPTPRTESRITVLFEDDQQYVINCQSKRRLTRPDLPLGGAIGQPVGVPISRDELRGRIEVCASEVVAETEQQRVVDGLTAAICRLFPRLRETLRRWGGCGLAWTSGSPMPRPS